MKVRLVNRRAAGARNVSSQQDNIFAQISEISVPRGIPALLHEPVTADVVRPGAFMADAAERVTRSSPNQQKGMACLAPDAKVVTQLGAKPVAELQEGDMLLTRDNGFQPVLWVKEVQGGKAVPMSVEIPAELLQPGSPDHTVRVSGRQGVLLNGSNIQALFGSREVLVRAGDLLHLDGIEEVEAMGTAHAILMPRHEVIHVNGVWMESFVPDSEARKHLTVEDKKQLKALLPSLTDLPTERSYPAARNVLTSAFARQITL